MSKKPLISVIIVNYNGKKFIRECIDSVLASDYPNFEIVIVDNASNDGSYELLKETYGENNKIRTVRTNKQLYFTGGSNLGAKNAPGEKLIFLNSDTVVTKNWLQELLNFVGNRKRFLAQPKILIRQLVDPKPPNLPNPPKPLIDNAGGRYIFPGFGIGIGRGEVDRGQYDKNYQVDFVNGTCFMIDKEFFEVLDGFDETYRFFYEDIDLCLRAKRAGGQCFFCGKSVIYHKRGQTIKTALSQEEVNFYIHKNRLRTVIKNFTGPNRWIRIVLIKIISILSRASLLIKAKHQPFVNRLRFYELKNFIKQDKFTLLDLGCGDGSFVSLIQQHGIEALGVDKNAPSGPNFIASPIEELQLNKKFDVVTMFHVLEHVKNPKEVLEKATSFLKKDAVLVIEVPLTGNLTEKFLGKNYFAYYDASHIKFFSKKEIFDLLAKVGLKTERKGFTLLQFPLTVLTTSIKQGFWQTLKGIAFFAPLKLLTILGVNDEILRLYCETSPSNPPSLRLSSELRGITRSNASTPADSGTVCEGRVKEKALSLANRISGRRQKGN